MIFYMLKYSYKFLAVSLAIFMVITTNVNFGFAGSAYASTVEDIEVECDTLLLLFGFPEGSIEELDAVASSELEDIEDDFEIVDSDIFDIVNDILEDCRR